MLSETEKGQLVVALCKFATEARKEGTITHGIKCLGDAVKEIESLLAAELRAELAKPLREDTMTNKHVGSRFEMKDTAVERVAKALFELPWQDYPGGPFVHIDWRVAGPYERDDLLKQATVAIAAHTAWLRERSKDADVVEAAAKALYDFDREGTDRPGWGSLQSGHHTDGVKGRRYYRHEANAALYAALDVLLGKENADDR